MKRNHEKGQKMVEYGLILFLVAVVVLVIWAFFGPAVNKMFQNLKADVPQQQIQIAEYCNEEAQSCFVLKEKNPVLKDNLPNCPKTLILNDNVFTLNTYTCRLELQPKSIK